MLKETDEFDWNKAEYIMEISDKEYRHTKLMMFIGGMGTGAILTIIALAVIGLYFNI